MTSNGERELAIVELDDGQTVIFAREDGNPIEGEAIHWDGPVLEVGR